jgi:hypothetical protein
MIKTMQDRQPGLGTTGISGTLTLTKTGTTARTATFPDASIGVQSETEEQTGNFTARVHGQYIATATLTVTDPTPSQGHEYVVHVRNGTATVGGVAYSAGQTIWRSYHSGAWSNNLLTSSGSTLLTSGRVPYVTTGGLLTDSATLTFGASRLTIGAGTGVDANLDINGIAGYPGSISYKAAGVLRWLYEVADTESGSDTGSAFRIRARNDAGSAIDNPLTIVRAAGGAITLARPVTCTGAVTVPNGTAAAPGIRLTSEAHGLYRVSATELGVSVAGVLSVSFIGQSVIIPTSTAITTAGTFQRETNQDKHYAYANGIGGWVDKCIFSQYASVTQSGIVTSQSLASATARGTRTLPANFFKQGKVMRFRLCGRYTTDVAPGNATIDLKLGSTTFRTTGSYGLDASVTNLPWEIEGEITCYTTGATGTVEGVAWWAHGITGATGNFNIEPMAGTGTVTIDTTAAQAFDVQWTATDAGTSITCTCFRMWEVC